MSEGQMLKVADIIVPDRYRKQYGDIDDLAADIEQHGLISPIAVKDIGDGKYSLLAGGRRLAAHVLLKREDILVRIYPSSLTELDARAIELAENIKRMEMDWTEEAALTLEIHRLQSEIHGEQKNYNDDGWSQRKTAQLLGRSDAIVSDDLDIARALELMPELAQFAKSKTEASKLLKKLGQEVAMERKSADIRAAKADTPKDKQKQQLIASYNICDFFDWAAGQPSEFYDCAEIDPPYGIDLIANKMSDSKGSPLQTSEGYNEVGADDYMAFVSRVLLETYRILKPDAWLILWTSWRWFEDVYRMTIRTGFVGNNIPLIWIKNIGQTMHPELYLGSACEPAFYLRKGNAQIVSTRKGRLNVYDYRTIPPTNKSHPTERPIEMMEDILSTFCEPGAMIVSPFLGSGNTILAANNINCTCVGCDLNKVYQDYFTVKVQQGKIGDYNSYGRK